VCGRERKGEGVRERERERERGREGEREREREGEREGAVALSGSWPVVDEDLGPGREGEKGRWSVCVREREKGRGSERERERKGERETGREGEGESGRERGGSCTPRARNLWSTKTSGPEALATVCAVSQSFLRNHEHMCQAHHRLQAHRQPVLPVKL
jgi:hypothetical protein